MSAYLGDRRGEADAIAVGYFEGFDEFEGRTLGVLDEVSSLQLLLCSVSERDLMDLEERKWN